MKRRRTDLSGHLAFLFHVTFVADKSDDDVTASRSCPSEFSHPILRLLKTRLNKKRREREKNKNQKKEEKRREFEETKCGEENRWREREKG